MSTAELHALVEHRCRLPDLSFGEKRNVSRKNADDGDAHAVEANRFADDGRIGPERMHPDAMAEEYDLWKIERFVGLGEVAAKERRYAESLEEIRGDRADEHLLGSIAGKIGWTRIVAQCDQAVEGLVGGAIVAKVWW